MTIDEFDGEWELSTKALKRIEKHLRNKTLSLKLLETGLKKGSINSAVSVMIDDYDIGPFSEDPATNSGGAIRRVVISKPGRICRLGPAFFSKRLLSIFSSYGGEWLSGTFTMAERPFGVLITHPAFERPMIAAPHRTIMYGVCFKVDDVEFLIEDNIPKSERTAREKSRRRAAAQGRLQLREADWQQILEPLTALAQKAQLGVGGHGFVAEVAERIRKLLEAQGHEASPATLRRRADQLIEINESALQRPPNSANDHT